MECVFGTGHLLMLSVLDHRRLQYVFSTSLKISSSLGYPHPGCIPLKTIHSTIASNVTIVFCIRSQGMLRFVSLNFKQPCSTMWRVINIDRYLERLSEKKPTVIKTNDNIVLVYVLPRTDASMTADSSCSLQAKTREFSSRQGTPHLRQKTKSEESHAGTVVHHSPDQ